MINLVCERCRKLIFVSWNVSPDEVARVRNIKQLLTADEVRTLDRAWDRHEGEYGHTCRLRLKSTS